jgi:hypothetical protein
LKSRFFIDLLSHLSQIPGKVRNTGYDLFVLHNFLFIIHHRLTGITTEAVQPQELNQPTEKGYEITLYFTTSLNALLTWI